MIDINEIQITDSVVSDLAGNVYTDYTDINLDVAPKHVLCSAINYKELNIGASFAKLSGALLVILQPPTTTVSPEVLARFEALGIAYTVVKSEDLVHCKDVENNIYTYSRGVTYLTNRKIGILTLAQKYPDSVMFEYIPNDSRYLRDTGLKVVEIKLNGNADSITELILQFASSTKSRFKSVTEKVAFKDVADEFEDKSIDVRIAKSIRELYYSYVSDALHFASTNDCALIYKRIGLTW